MATSTKTPPTPTAELAGKYLTFRLGDEQYGIDILRVREIIGLMEITRVPRTPDHIRGVINLRGRIIPVLHLRVRFGMDVIDDTAETCIIVVDAVAGRGAAQVGILVDSVCEVLDIQPDELVTSPAYGDGTSRGFLRGIAECKGEVRLLLDTEQVVGDADPPPTSGAG